MNLLRILSLYYKFWNFFLGYSSKSGKIITLQKQYIKHGASCRHIFKQLEILTFMLVYTFIINFNIHNREKFQTNSSTQNINTRNDHDFTNQVLLFFKKRAFYFGIKIFKTFPRSLKILKNESKILRSRNKILTYLLTYSMVQSPS